MKYLVIAVLSGMAMFTVIQQMNEPGKHGTAVQQVSLGTEGKLSDEDEAFVKRIEAAYANQPPPRIVDVNEILRREETTDFCTMFLGAGKAFSENQKEDAAFLFFAATIRGKVDYLAYPPVGTGGNSPMTLFGAMKHQLGYTINPFVMRNPKVYAKVVQRLEEFSAQHNDSYEPGWEYKSRMSPEMANAKSKKYKSEAVAMMRKMSKLLNDPEYAKLFKKTQDQNFGVEFLRQIDSDPNYTPIKLSNAQIDALNQKAAKIEAKYGFDDLFGRNEPVFELPKKWLDDIAELKEESDKKKK